MQKKIKKHILIVFITMILFLMQYQMFNKSIVYAENISVGQTWEYNYKETEISYNDQEFIAPITGVYEIKVYGETNAKINLRVKDANNPDTLVTSYQIQGGNGGMACGYLKMNEGEKIFIHIMKGNSAGQIEQTTKQLQNIDLKFGEYCFISKTGTYYDDEARIYKTGGSLLRAEGGGYHCTDYEHGYSINGDGEINTEMCPEINYNGVTYSPQIQEGGGIGKASCVITLKANEDNSIAYTVNHWQQNINGNENQHDSSNYALKETENLVTTIGKSISPTTKTYSGFTSPEIQTITINQNGTTVIDYYYTRNKYQYTLEECEGVATTGSTPSGLYYYESTIILKADVEDGYLWSKWSNNDSNLETTLSMPANDLNITPVATKKEPIITEEQEAESPQEEVPRQTEDTTTTTEVLPQAGVNMKSLFVISIILIASIIFYMKDRSFRDIN